MDTIGLKNWILANKVEEQIKQAFKKCFKNYKASYPDEFFEYFGEFNVSLLEAKMGRVCLSINDWPEAEEECIIAFVPIIYKGEELGIYKLYFYLDGESFDDALIMYSEYYIDRN